MPFCYNFDHRKSQTEKKNRVKEITRGTSRGIRISRLAKLPTFFVIDGDR